MPGKTEKKDIYLARQMSDLNKLAEDFPKVSNPRVYVKSAEKVFRMAEDVAKAGDEEKAYVMYMKFFNIVSAIKKTSEYKKNQKYFQDMIGMKTCVHAINQAESLASSLKDRYDEMEAKEVSRKLERMRSEDKTSAESDDLEISLPEPPKDDDEEVSSENAPAAGDSNGTVEKPEDSGCISVHQLYSMLSDSTTSLLIMDVRSESEFASSHIKHPNCINIPPDIVPPGSVASFIENRLPSLSREGWITRDSVDVVILYDWHSNKQSLNQQNTLCCLRDAIYKWDRSVIMKKQPVVLEGGYQEWLYCYPMYTTNANVKPPPLQSSPKSSVPSLDSIEYDMDFGFLNPEVKKVEPPPAPVSTIEEISNIISKPEMPMNNQNIMTMPMVDRSRKPKVNNDVANVPPKDVNIAPMNLPQTVTNDISAQKNNSSKQEKESNVSKVARNKPEPEVASVPRVDRGLKPSGNTAKVTNDLSQTKEELERIAAQKAQELLKYKEDKAQLDAQHRQTLSRLELDQKRLDDIDEVKRTQMRQTADLMREKRKIAEEIEKLKQEKATREEEEKKRQAELARIQQEAETKKAAAAAAASASATAAAAATNAAVDISSPRPSPTHQAKKPGSDVANSVNAAKPAAVDDAKKKKLEDEAKKAEAAAIEKRRAEEKAKQLAEMRRLEEQQKKKDQEAEKEKQEQNAKIDQPVKPKSDGRVGVVSASGVTGLPPGWTKVLDQTTGRYFYLNHNTGQFTPQPPEPEKTLAKVAKPPLQGEYKEKLKDEGEQSGGLRRSHSSPNIAQMIQQEEAEAAARAKAQAQSVKPLPSVDRTVKPKPIAPQAQVPFKAEVAAAKVRNLQPVWGNVGRGLTGLRNMGNTCYMNSAVQCFSNTSFLATYFLMDNYKHDINRENFLGNKGEVAEEFAVLIKSLWSGQYRSVTPRDFKATVAKYHTLFEDFKQQDAQELLLFLMDGLHEDLNKVRQRPKLPEQENDGIPDMEAAHRAWGNHKKLNDSIIVGLFQGLFKSTLRCLKCDKQSVTFEAFMYLSLPIPSSTRCTLRECLQQFSKEEKMTGDSKWLCPRCKVKRESIKRITIWKLPPILIIHLKRFYYQGMWRQKINANVDFPIEGLDFTHFVAGPPPKSHFNLYAVSNHYGTMEGGHYTAYCKNPTAQKWFKFDDHEVYQMNTSDIKSSAAYILFYTSIQQDIHFK